jgi:hypothetical protein
MTKKCELMSEELYLASNLVQKLFSRQIIQKVILLPRKIEFPVAL